MKKIIANKVYDTSTAIKIAAWDNGHYANDLDYISEDLYRKKTGEFFLHGDGGARTRYARRDGNNYGAGEAIMPLDFDRAKEWAQAHLDGDEYERIFGAIPEGDGSALNVEINPGVLAAARNASTAAGMTLGGWVEAAMRKALE